MADSTAVVPSADGASTVPQPAVAPQPYWHSSGITPQLQNVVSTVNLGCKLDLAAIAQSARNAEYNPKRFAACIVRIREPKTTALMFNSGKMVIAGAKSEEASRLAARKYTKILLKLGYQVTFKEFTVQNMVASCSVNFPIRLEGLAVRFDIFCNYEPEVFPGLVFRMRNPNVVLLIFVTGKIVITGAKKVEEIYRAFDNVYPVLQDFRKDDARRIVRTPAAGTTALPSIAAAPAQGALQSANIGSLTGVPQELIEDVSGAPSVAPRPQPTPMMLPPPTPAASLPPPTPGANVPPPTPAQGLMGPPMTPSHGVTIPPPATFVPAPFSVPPPTPVTSLPPPPT